MIGIKPWNSYNNLIRDLSHHSEALENAHLHVSEGFTKATMAATTEGDVRELASFRVLFVSRSEPVGVVSVRVLVHVRQAVGESGRGSNNVALGDGERLAFPARHLEITVVLTQKHDQRRVKTQRFLHRSVEYTHLSEHIVVYMVAVSPQDLSLFFHHCRHELLVPENTIP